MKHVKGKKSSSTLATPQQQLELLQLMLQKQAHDEKQDETKAFSTKLKLQSEKIKYFTVLYVAIQGQLETLDAKQMPTIVRLKEEFNKPSIEAFKLANLCCQVLIESQSTDFFLKVYTFLYQKIYDLYSFQEQYISIIFLEYNCLNGLWRNGYFVEAKKHIKAVHTLLESDKELFSLKENKENLNGNLIRIYLTEADILLNEYLCDGQSQDSEVLVHLNELFIKMRVCLSKITNSVLRKELADYIQQQDTRTKNRLAMKKTSLNLQNSKTLKDEKEKTQWMEESERQKKENTELKQQLSNLKKEVVQLIVKNRKLRDNSKVVLKRNETLEDENQKQKLKSEELINENLKLKKQIALLETRSEAIITENSQLKSKLDTVENSVEELKKEKCELNLEIQKSEDLETENLKLKEQTADLETRESHLQDRLAIAENSIVKLKSEQKSDFENEVSGYRKKIRCLKTKNGNLYRRNREIQNIKRIYGAENDDLRNRLVFFLFRNAHLQRLLIETTEQKQSRDYVIKDLEQQIGYLKLLLLQLESSTYPGMNMLVPAEQFIAEDSVVILLPFDDVGHANQNLYYFFTVPQQSAVSTQVSHLLNTPCL